MLYCARFEVHPLGLFDNRIESDLARHQSPVLSISAGYAYLASAKGRRGILGSAPSDGGTTDYHNATADVSFKYRGFSVFGDFYFRQGERNYGDATVLDPDTGTLVPAELEDARNGIGWNGQVGYLLFGRIDARQVVGRCAADDIQAISCCQALDDFTGNASCQRQVADPVFAHPERHHRDRIFGRQDPK